MFLSVLRANPRVPADRKFREFPHWHRPDDLMPEEKNRVKSSSLEFNF